MKAMKMKRLPILMGVVLAMVILFTSVASADVSINIQVQPRLVPVPGVPVYYAPELPYNYFVYGGQYYVFVDGIWYLAPTYRGPWAFVPLASVPPPLLGVPVDFYRVPLPGWYRGGPPPWARHRQAFREREEHERRAFERERRERHGEGRWEGQRDWRREEHREGREGRWEGRH